MSASVAIMLLGSSFYYNCRSLRSGSTSNFMKKSNSKITAICDIQGSGLWSEYAGQEVTVRGVVTAVDRHGFFIQSTKPGPNPLESDAIFVFSRKWPAPPRALLEVSGQVVDYIKIDNGKPMTQIKLDNVRLQRVRKTRLAQCWV